MKTVRLSMITKVILLQVLFLLLYNLSEFVIFTYRLPWLDVFANPPGW